MKKKLLLIFFIVLIVIFLIILINRTDDINEIVNNTINNSDEYKYTLTFKYTYYKENEKMVNEIKYIEQKKNNLYKFTNQIFDNNTLTRETISYLDGSKYYYKENDKYKEKELKDIDSVKDFDIDLKEFFSNIKNISRYKVENNKKYYKTKMKSEDAFSLIYNNSKNSNLDKYTNRVIITANNNSIEDINFKVYENQNNYTVNLKIDVGLQDIKLDIK